MLLAIETSCDETAVALIDVERYARGDWQATDEIVRAELLASQAAAHAPYGGVVPELAAREHCVALPQLVQQVLLDVDAKTSDISAVAVTRGPGLKGCLLVGINFAKALSYALGVPVYPVNHLEGHLFASEFLPTAERPAFPMLALLVSGGHTALVLCNGFRDYQLLATTRDDAAGEAFDKIATLLGLDYPGGPALSQLAQHGNAERFPLPIGVADDPSSFSFSGFKTAVSRIVGQSSDIAGDDQFRADVAAATQYTIVTALAEKTEAALQANDVRSLFLTGGVAANTELRQRLAQLAGEHDVQFVAAPPKWCTDNAVMIGAVGAQLMQRGGGDDLSFGALPRWPLDEIV